MATCEAVRECQRGTPIDKRSVVRITVACIKTDALRPNLRSESAGGTGTGFFLEGCEYAGAPCLITAYHVVADALSIRVDTHTATGELRRASLLGACPELDVAVLRVERVSGDDTPPMLPMGDSCACTPEQRVRAVGYANGKDHLSSTGGTVSGRTVMSVRGAIQSFLQLDCAINPGNSGGAVVDEDGRVLAVVVAGLANAQNTNYSIPIFFT